MKYLATSIFLSLLCLPLILSGRPITETPERQHYAAEIKTSLPELPPEIQEDNDLFVKFAMGCYFPEDYDELSPKEFDQLIAEKAQTFLDVLQQYPDSEIVVDKLLFYLSDPKYCERMREEAQKLIDQGRNSASLQLLYLSTLKQSNAIEGINALLPQVLADHPDSGELLVFALEHYAMTQDNDAKIDELLKHLQEIPRYDKHPIFLIVKMKRLLDAGQKELADELLKELETNPTFLSDPINYIYTVWNSLAPSNSFYEISYLFNVLTQYCDFDIFTTDFLVTFLTKGIYAACYAESYDIANNFLDILAEADLPKRQMLSIRQDIRELLFSIDKQAEKQYGSIPKPLVELNIRIGREIHAGLPIMYKDDTNDRITAEFLLMGQYPEEALKYLKHIQSPTLQDQLHIVSALLQTDRKKDALNFMRKMGKDDTGQLPAHFYSTLALLEERFENFQASEEAYQKALQLDPRCADAANGLGYSYAVRGVNLEKAAELIKIALEEEPDNSAFQDSMAWIQFKQGNTTEALRWMAKAYKDVDTYHEIYYQTDKAIHEELSEHLREILKDLHCDYLADFY